MLHGAWIPCIISLSSGQLCMLYTFVSPCAECSTNQAEHELLHFISCCVPLSIHGKLIGFYRVVVIALEHISLFESAHNAMHQSTC
mmetsp:Transcript_3982/g.7647  ORF Transcript_3982/g.7647 Transcript_3982/m.7647 type:complete len:86 (+) Transcript_3982:153-410(+)